MTVSTGRRQAISPLAMALGLSLLWLLAGIFQPLGFVPSLAIVSILVIVFGALYLPRTELPSGFPRWKSSLLGIAVGAIGLGLTHLIAIVLFPLWPEGRTEMGRLAALVSAEWPPVPAFLATALIGTSEEILWRGFGHRGLIARYSRILAITLGTLWYALCQVGLGAVLPVVAALVLGAVTGFLRYYTGGLAAPIGMHLVWTLGVVWVFPP